MPDTQTPTVELDEALVRRLYESVPLLMGVVETTADDILHRCDNRAARGFFGQEQTDGRWASEMGVSPEEVALWLHWYARARATGEPAHFEFLHEDRSFSVHVTWLGRAPSGRPSFSYVAEETTSRRRAQEAARRHLLLTRTIAETAPDAILLADPHGRTTYANPAAIRTFGFTEDELLDRRAHDVLHTRHPDGRPYAYEDCPLSAAHAGHVVHDHEDLFFHKDGTPIPVACSAAPVMRDGQVVASVIVIRDVTERHRARRDAAAAAEALNATLEQRVAERTAELAAANEELRAFSYSVSHDLRAPLRAIDAYAAFLADDHTDETSRGHLARIRAGAQRMAHLIDGLLDLSRIGRLELRRAEVDLGLLAAEAVAELRRCEPDRDVVVRIAPDLRAAGDDRLLYVAMENLLANAWKYTRPRAVAHVEVGRDDDGFYVRDDGVGFDMRHAKLLFEPFQRLHGAGEFEGSGIGLATVARIVRRHGGRIWAEAAPGSGATFRFTLGRPR